MSLTLLNEHRQPVVVATTTEDSSRPADFVGRMGGRDLLLPQHARAGALPPDLTISHRGEGLDVIDRFAGGLSFVVTGMTSSGGMVEIPVETEILAGAPTDQAK